MRHRRKNNLIARDSMKKFTKNILQITTGVCTMVTLCAGKAMALTVQEGAEAARADGMPENLVGVDGVFNRITNTALAIAKKSPMLRTLSSMPCSVSLSLSLLTPSSISCLMLSIPPQSKTLKLLCFCLISLPNLS